MSGSYLNNDFKVTIKTLEDDRSKQHSAQATTTVNYSDNFKSFNMSKDYNVYNFDDVEYTHVTRFNKNANTNILKQKFDESRPATINSQTKFLSNNSSSSNNASTNTNNINAAPNTHSINILNSSDTFSSFNTSAKENVSETNVCKTVFNGAPQNDSSSLIIDLNGSRRSNGSSSNATHSSYSSSNASKHGQLNLYDCNSMLEQFNSEFNSFNKCSNVISAPAPFGTNFNQNLNSNSIKQMLKPVELIVKDDASNCNDIHLLQHLLDRFENFYTGPPSNSITNHRV